MANVSLVKTLFWTKVNLGGDQFSSGGGQTTPVCQPHRESTI